MKRYCSEECKKIGPMCDFCKFYDFNGDKYGFYIERGYCRFHKKAKEPFEGCKDFVCFRIKRGEL